MKKILMLLAAILLTNVMYAQNDDYDRVTAGYSMLMLHQKEDNDISNVHLDQKSMCNGGELNFVHGFSLSDKTPLYVELGFRLSFNTWRDDETENRYERKDRYTVIASSVPVNLTYKFDMGDFYIAPFAGAQLRFNDMARRKGSTKSALDLRPSSYNENLLRDPDGWRIFQVAGQAGINIGYQHFNLGIAYMMYTPILSISRDKEYYKYHFNELSCTIGYNF